MTAAPYKCGGLYKPEKEFFMQKTVAVLGATGSVGAQALDVAAANGYKVDLLCASVNVKEMERAARAHLPTYAVMADESAASELRVRLADTPVRVLSGSDGICEAVAESSADTVINAILGAAGLAPTLAALDAGKRLALSNKESLVIAGELVTSRARASGGQIIPVDSEHSAIFQSLLAGRHSEIKKIILTASGGPFYGMSREAQRSVTLADALLHPTWRMGRKITIDSATLMNKGFEVIEAVHLFGVTADKVEVTVHRESILHSAVEYVDNTVIGQMSVPDMRACVKYAVEYPNRTPSHSEPLDLFKVGTLTFARPDMNSFPLLPLAYRAITDGGAMGAVLNAADEIAVEAFLCERISFYDISEVVCEVYDALGEARSATALEAIMEYDAAARALASKYIEKRR